MTQQPKSLKDMWQQAGDPGLPGRPVTLDQTAHDPRTHGNQGPKYALRRFFSGVRETANLMIGIPSYENYLAHMANRHPDIAPMSEIEFFRNRQEARYGAGGARCC
ncbi:YbdD/YjiX family protein [Pedomonas sp.]|uniref:YbdD/YjiX family protein n=1 Tax=Pedomonas sp. TaxID=2976421 RepID=UPI0032C233BC